VRRALLLACALVLLTACGSGDDTVTTATTMTTSTTEPSLGPALPAELPAVGIAETYAGGIRLWSLDGGLLADLPHMVLDSRSVPGGPLFAYEWLEGTSAAQSPVLRLDPASARWVRQDPPPEPGADVRPPSVPDGITLLGHWRWAVASSVDGTLLAQWSGECEVPAAFFVGADGVPRSVLGGDWIDEPNTIGIGWLPDGRALVEVQGLDAGCGHGVPEPGVYAIDPATGERTRFHDLDGEGVVWGAASAAFRASS
jgi:hypothetical protein